MVSTRSHPTSFPPPDASPTKMSPRKSRTSTPAPTASPDQTSPSAAVGRNLRERVGDKANGYAARAEEMRNGRSGTLLEGKGGGWSHTASNVTLAWIAVSLPLVICKLHMSRSNSRWQIFLQDLGRRGTDHGLTRFRGLSLHTSSPAYYGWWTSTMAYLETL